MTIFTREQLVKALFQKAGTVWAVRDGEMTAQDVADNITKAGLESVLTGYRQDAKPVTFAQGFELVFGERLSMGRRA